jgi:hypothetical protein
MSRTDQPFALAVECAQRLADIGERPPDRIERATVLAGHCGIDQVAMDLTIGRSHPFHRRGQPGQFGFGLAQVLVGAVDLAVGDFG